MTKSQKRKLSGYSLHQIEAAAAQIMSTILGSCKGKRWAYYKDEGTNLPALQHLAGQGKIIFEQNPLHKTYRAKALNPNPKSHDNQSAESV